MSTQPTDANRETHVVTTTHAAVWRFPIWDDDIPSRRAWLNDCSVCGELAEGWGYSTSGAAHGAARRHENHHKAKAAKRL